LTELGRWQSEYFAGKEVKSNKRQNLHQRDIKVEFVITQLNKQAEENQITELTKYQYLHSYFLELQFQNDRNILNCNNWNIKTINDNGNIGVDVNDV
jgi:hypothetical protein